MKRLVLYLLALAIGLSACAPAVSETAGEAPATAETAGTPPAAEITAETARASVGDLTMNGHLRVQEGYYCYLGIWSDPESGEAKWALFRLDFDTGQRRLLQTFGPYEGMSPSGPLIQDGKVYCIQEREIYSSLVDGSEKQVIPAQEAVNWMFSDENACYELESNVFNGQPRPRVKRTDLQTGTVTSWDLPAINLISVHGSRGSRVLVSRCITDQPLPSFEDIELFDVVMQNATMEYGWLDLATGDWQGILRYPYEGQKTDGDRTAQWSYEGINGDTLYFQRMVTDSDGNILSTTLERCALDGSDMTEVLKLPSGRNLYSVWRGEQLVWLMDYNYSDPATIYDLETGKTWENIPIQSGDSGRPMELTRDGRVLVNDHYNKWGGCNYAILDADDYLSGSRDWTVFTDAEN